MIADAFQAGWDIPLITCKSVACVSCLKPFRKTAFVQPVVAEYVHSYSKRHE